MLIDLHYLVGKYNMVIKGILHVGAHECEEMKDYLRYLTIDKIVWVEALQDKVELSRTRYPGVQIENVLVDETDGKMVKFNRTNNGQSSSILEMGLHRVNHPHVWNVSSAFLTTTVLSNILCKYPTINCNFINLDIQGIEMRALKGMEGYLIDGTVEYIYTEVNDAEVYIDCDLINEMDSYLHNFGFQRVETKFCENFHWGDALYLRGSTSDIKNKPPIEESR